MWESMRIWFSHPSHRALLQVSKLIIENCLNRPKNIFPHLSVVLRLEGNRHTHSNYLWRSAETCLTSLHTDEVLVQILWSLIKLFCFIQPSSLGLHRDTKRERGEKIAQLGVDLIHPLSPAIPHVYIEYEFHALLHSLCACTSLLAAELT